MQEPELILEATAYTIDQLIHRNVPQIALAGRSNVGKSSLINALARRRALAKVSATPGKTRSVNYYRVSPYDFCLVDLPGYGYARAGHAEREEWARLLERYLKECQQLRSLILLIDSRLEPQKLDLQLAGHAKSIGLHILPVLTKADKCRQRDISLRQNEWEKILGVRPLPTSSAKKTGLRNLWRAILREMDIAVDDGNTPEPEKVLPGDSEN